MDNLTAAAQLGSIGSMAVDHIGAGMLDTDSQHTVFERVTEECESVNQTNSVDKENFESYPIELSHQFKPLSSLEKTFLLAVERGDLPAVRR